MIILMLSGILLKFTYLLTVFLWLAILKLDTKNYDEFNFIVDTKVLPIIKNSYFTFLWYTGGFICIDTAILVYMLRWIILLINLL